VRKKKMTIKNNKPKSDEPLPLRNDAPPLQPNGEDRAPGEPRARRMLTEAEVLDLIPFSRTTLWRREKEGTFPEGRYISANRKVWFEDEVRAWQDALDQGRRSPKH
jgi:prophage regulatory protein